MLKGTDRAVVLSVRFELREDGLSAPVRYAELARMLGVEPGARVPAPTPAKPCSSCAAARAWCSTRRPRHVERGLVLHQPDRAGGGDRRADGPHRRRRPEVPGQGRVPKLSAAWLIERAGFAKGFPGPGKRVSLSSKHTLALTNRGYARTEDLLGLARQVRDGVYDAFGITLRPEPVLVGCRL